MPGLGFPRRRSASFSARFALLLGALGAFVALGSATIALTQSSRQSRQLTVDRALDRAAVAGNLLHGQEQALQVFVQSAGAQVDQAGDPPGSPALEAYLVALTRVISPGDVVAVTGPTGTSAATQGRLLQPGDPVLASISATAGASIVVGPDGNPLMVQRRPLPGHPGEVVAMLRPIDATTIRNLSSELGSGPDPTDLVVVRDGRYALAGSLAGGAVTAGATVPAALDVPPGESRIGSVGGGDSGVAAMPLGAGYTLVAVTSQASTDSLGGGIVGPVTILAGAVIVLALVLVFVVVERELQRPLRHLDRAVEALGREDFDAPVPSAGDNEIGRLGARFEAMRRELRAVLTSAEARAEIATDLTATAPLSLALDQVCERLRSTTGARSSLILLTDPDDDQPRAHASGVDAPPDVGSLLNGDGPIGAAARLSRLEALNACATDGAPERATGMRDVCAAPLRIGLRTLGVVAVADRPDGFSAGDSDLLGTAAEQIALAVMRERVLTMARHQASTDGLTGLYNYRFLVDHLDRQLALAERSSSSLTVLMLDLDRFKAINDAYGHDAGDEALRVFSRTVLGTIRRSDLAARYGGEEFVVVMSNTSGREARLVADKIRTRVAALRLPMEGHPTPARFTVSIGGASFPDDASGSRDLLRAADGALYRAKSEGRNRVFFVGGRGRRAAAVNR